MSGMPDLFPCQSHGGEEGIFFPKPNSGKYRHVLVTKRVGQSGSWSLYCMNCVIVAAVIYGIKLSR